MSIALLHPATCFNCCLQQLGLGFMVKLQCFVWSSASWKQTRMVEHCRKLCNGDGSKINTYLNLSKHLYMSKYLGSHSRIAGLGRRVCAVFLFNSVCSNGTLLRKRFVIPSRLCNSWSKPKLVVEFRVFGFGVPIRWTLSIFMDLTYKDWICSVYLWISIHCRR